MTTDEAPSWQFCAVCGWHLGGRSYLGCCGHHVIPEVVVAAKALALADPTDLRLSDKRSYLVRFGDLMRKERTA